MRAHTYARGDDWLADQCKGAGQRQQYLRLADNAVERARIVKAAHKDRHVLRAGVGYERCKRHEMIRSVLIKATSRLQVAVCYLARGVDRRQRGPQGF